MKYFENLPIINIKNQYFRNLFFKIMVSYININELISYELNEYDTLPIISYKLYGTTDYWWTIALLNNIQDIEYDLPMSEEKIAEIAEKESAEKKYASSILSSGIFNMEDAENINKVLVKTIPFKNPNMQNAYCHVTPYLDYSEDEEVNKENILNLQSYGECSCQIVNDLANEKSYAKFSVYIGVNPPEEPSPTASSRKIRQYRDQLEAYQKICSIKYSYVVISDPEILKVTNNSLYKEIYKVLLDENMLKRNIRLIRSQNIGQIINEFINALNNNTNFNNYYTKEINLMKNFNPYLNPVENMVSEINNDISFGNSLSKKLDNSLIKNAAYQIQIMPNTPNEYIGYVGDLSVMIDEKSNPIVYRTSNTTSIGNEFSSNFNYIIFDSAKKDTSLNKEMITFGTANLINPYSGISGNYADIQINDIRVSGPYDIGVMTTVKKPNNPNAADNGNQGNVGFQVLNQHTVRIWNTGNPTFVYYAIYLNNISEDIYNLNYADSTIVLINENLLNIYSYDEITPFVCIFLNSINQDRKEFLHLVGNIGYMISPNKLQFNIYNSGSENMPFIYSSLIGKENGIIFIDNEGEELYFKYDYINSAEDINLYLIPFLTDSNDLENYGNFGLQQIDKNTVKVFSNQFERKRYRYCLIDEWLEQGYGTFNPIDGTEIEISNHTEISYKEDIKLLIMPIFENGIIFNSGSFCYVVENLNKIKIFNSGKSGLFKWCLIKEVKEN